MMSCSLPPTAPVAAPADGAVAVAGDQQKRRGNFAGFWFICDLDATLVAGPWRNGGLHPPLSLSPCGIPVLHWLRNGGNLAVISTAGTNLFRQVLVPLINCAADPSTKQLSGDLVLCGWSGAAMFRVNHGSWDQAGREGGLYYMKEEQNYRLTAGAGGSTTCIDRQTAGRIRTVGEQVFRDMFALFAEDPKRVSLLSQRYRDDFTRVLQLRTRMGAAAFNSEVLTAKQLMTKSAFIQDAALMSFQAVPKAERHSSSSYSFSEHPQDEDFIIAQVSFLGVPSKLFDRIMEMSNAGAVFEKELGLTVVRQPNSVAISRRGVDKGIAVEYMLSHADQFRDINPAKVFIVGDQPATIDSSLLRFSTSFAMPFFSVGRGLSSHDCRDAPEEVRRALQAGGLIEWAELTGSYYEHGTALLFRAVMTYLDRSLSKKHSDNATALSFVRLIASDPSVLERREVLGHSKL